MWSLAEAQTRILERAEPGEAIEVPLPEAVGLVLAEPAVGDVDQPPFDRAAFDGYALRAADATQGVRHRLVARRRGQGCGEVEVGPGRAVRVGAGEAMPVGADAVLRTEDSRPEPAAGAGPPRLVEALRPVAPGANVIPRGERLRAGTLLAPAGTLTHSLSWDPGRATFRTLRGSGVDGKGETIAAHTFTSGVPAPETESVRLNFYVLYGQQNPLKHGVEVILEKFEYLP